EVPVGYQARAGEAIQIRRRDPVVAVAAEVAQMQGAGIQNDDFHRMNSTRWSFIMFFSLQGRVALVTGGGQGIGEGMSMRLALAGAKVGVFDREAAKAERVALAIGGIGLAGDVTSQTDLETAVEDLHHRAGPVDILVNNAGITGKAGRLWELTQQDLE